MKKKNNIADFFTPERKRMSIAKGGPLGMGWLGFIAPEIAQFIYAALTCVVILFTWTSIEEPTVLLWQRITAIGGTVALWVVYWLWPCRAVMLCRVGYLLAMLSFWYPDTYEINRQFGCMDHVFAACEQAVFHHQPAAVFAEKFSSPVISELMYMGYVSYYLFFVVVIAITALQYYKQLERVTYMVIASFFLCYTVYLFLPVTGPQYYYLAVGMEDILNGTFPDVEHYFAHSTECLQAPGWSSGLFYKLCQLAHQTGERPTAAFPSSHVAIATLVMAISVKMKMWRYLLILAIPYLFLCLSTVYIQAHYGIDAIAGLVCGVIFFFLFGGMKLRRA